MEWITDEQVRCLTQSFSNTGLVEVYFLLGNSQHVTSSLTLNITNNLTLLTINPKVGRYSGGTTVYIEVAHIENSAYLACRSASAPPPFFLCCCVRRMFPFVYMKKGLAAWIMRLSPLLSSIPQ